MSLRFLQLLLISERNVCLISLLGYENLEDYKYILETDKQK